MFEVARPYARRLLAERFSPRRIALRTRREAQDIAEIALEVPRQVHDVLERAARRGDVQVQIENPGIDDLDDHMDVAVNRIAVALVILGGLVGLVADRRLREGRAASHRAPPPRRVVGFVLSGVFGVWLVWGVFRSGRL